MSAIDHLRAHWSTPHLRGVLSRPPAQPREWRVVLPLPPGQPLAAFGGEENLDRVVTELVPAGWYQVGGIAVSQANATYAPTWEGWGYRVTLWPVAWLARTSLHAAPAVYAAAQLAGLATRVDGCLVADHEGIQFFAPDGRPLARECFHDGSAAWPPDVRVALAEIAAVDRRRTVGYMHARPSTGHAQLVADDELLADSERRERACGVITAWVRASHPEVLAPLATDPRG